MKDLAGKVAVITGAGSGFGREFARIAVREQMKLVLADVQQDALDAVAAECRAQGGEALAVHTDVSKWADVQPLLFRTGCSFVVATRTSRFAKSSSRKIG